MLRVAGMKGRIGALRGVATELSNHLACSRLASLTIVDVCSEIAGDDTNFDPRLKLLRKRTRCANIEITNPGVLRLACPTSQHIRLVRALARSVELAMPAPVTPRSSRRESIE